MLPIFTDLLDALPEPLADLEAPVSLLAFAGQGGIHGPIAGGVFTAAAHPSRPLIVFLRALALGGPRTAVAALTS